MYENTYAIIYKPNEAVITNGSLNATYLLFYRYLAIHVGADG